jgi:hypothetical protein
MSISRDRRSERRERFAARTPSLRILALARNFDGIQFDAGLAIIGHFLAVWPFRDDRQ